MGDAMITVLRPLSGSVLLLLLSATCTTAKESTADSIAVEHSWMEKAGGWAANNAATAIWGIVVTTALAAVLRPARRWYKRYRSLSQEVADLKGRLKQTDERLAATGESVEAKAAELHEKATRLETLEESLSAAKLRLEGLSEEPSSWAPERQSRFTWDRAAQNGFLNALSLSMDPPAMIGLRVEPGSRDLWRAGVIFYGRDIVDAQALFHWGMHEHGLSNHRYTGYPLGEGVDLRQSQYSLMYHNQQPCHLWVYVADDSVVVRFDHETYQYQEEALGLAPADLANPSLIGWCDDGLCDVTFTSITVRPATSADGDYMRTLAKVWGMKEALHEAKHSLSDMLDKSIQLCQMEASLSTVRAALREHGDGWFQRGDILHVLKRHPMDVDRETLDVLLIYMWQRKELERIDKGTPPELPRYRVIASGSSGQT